MVVTLNRPAMYNISYHPRPTLTCQPHNSHTPAGRSLTDRLRRPKVPRDRPRSTTGTPAAVLTMLLPGDRAHVPTMMAAAQCTRNTIHQAISRLRADGFTIETIPTPAGPWLCQFYRLAPRQEDKAMLYLMKQTAHELRGLRHDH